MTTRAPSQLYSSALNAGFAPPAALIMVEIEEAESGGDDRAIGDVNLEDATWGPSVGVPQIRTLKAQTGTGGVRDIQALTGDLADQQAAAFQISKGGTDFTPWSTYVSGKYQQFASLVAASVGGGASSTTVLASNSSGSGGLVDDWRGIALQGGGGLIGAALIVAGMIALAKPAIKSAGRKVKTAAKVAEVAAL